MNTHQALHPGPVAAPRRSAWIAGVVAAVALVGATAAALTRKQPQPDPVATASPALALAPAVAPAPKAVAVAPRPVARQAATTCQHCGTITSVQAVRQKGEASGTGAVIGGVLGGVVGNQMGKGDGRKAMTVIGAVGGGLAGNEIEKRRNSSTVYRVAVRMDDGSSRTLTRSEPWAVGRRVQLEGQSLRAL